jgi:hypothetical protein
LSIWHALRERRGTYRVLLGKPEDDLDLRIILMWNLYGMGGRELCIRLTLMRTSRLLHTLR